MWGAPERPPAHTCPLGNRVSRRLYSLLSRAIDIGSTAPSAREEPIHRPVLAVVLVEKCREDEAYSCAVIYRCCSELVPACRQPLPRWYARARVCTFRTTSQYCCRASCC